MERLFLLTPLREGRRTQIVYTVSDGAISTHAPAGGATIRSGRNTAGLAGFLLTPLREGRLHKR